MLKGYPNLTLSFLGLSEHMGSKLAKIYICY